MPHCFGYRAKTRDLFSRPYRKHGTIPLNKYLVSYKVGDIVDIKSDSRVHKSLPHKFYHGKTGKVFDVNPHALGVIVNKPVRGNILRKKIRVRVEHVQKSRSREDFIERVKKNAANKEAGAIKKRLPVAPKEGFFVISKTTEIIDQHPPVFSEKF